MTRSSLLKAGCAAGTFAVAMVALAPVVRAQSESAPAAYSTSFPFAGEACHQGGPKEDSASISHRGHGAFAAYGILFLDSGGATAGHGPTSATSTATATSASSAGAPSFSGSATTPLPVPPSGGDRHDGGAPPAVGVAAPAAPVAGGVTTGRGTAPAAGTPGAAKALAAGDPPGQPASLPSPTPEPTTMLLIASGLGGVAVARRRAGRKSE